MLSRTAIALTVGVILSHDAVLAQEQVTIRAVGHPPSLAYHEEIAALYMKDNPNVRIAYSAPPGDYAELIQETLRASLTDNPVDLGFYGNFTVPTLIDRGLAVPLDDFIAAEGNWAGMGYSDNMMSVSGYGGTQYGIPFSITLPVVFYNAQLVEAAGGDVADLPMNWEGIIELAAGIDALGDDTAGLFMRMDDTWMFQALVFSQGGTLMNGTEVAFDDETGRWAVETLERIGSAANMPAFTHGQARQLFAAGKLGILVSSGAVASGLLAGAEGNFDVVATGFPEVSNASRLPGGGNAAVIVSPDSEKHAAIWDYVKFATGPVGQTIMAKATGYFPVNDRAVTAPDLLGTFYAENPVYAAGIAERNLTTKWYAFPGENGIEIDQMITDTLLDVIHDRAEPDEAMTRMVKGTRDRL